MGPIWACCLLFIVMWPALPGTAAAGGTKAMEKDGADKGTVVTVTIADNGREIVLGSGGILEIELRTMGAAGYSWEFDSLDTEYLDVISRGAKALSDRTGAPVLSACRLKAKKSGATKIVMYNCRVWEAKEKFVDRFVLDVRIE